MAARVPGQPRGPGRLRAALAAAAGAAPGAGFFEARDRAGRASRSARASPVVRRRTSIRAATRRSRALAKLRAPFRPDGTVTAGNASGVNDGACALILASRSGAAATRPDAARARRRHGDRRRAAAHHGHRPGAGDAARCWRWPGCGSTGCDVIELNEAFAAQALAVLRELGLPDDAEHVNPNGGAIALGHPLGMCGARLVTTAINELHRTGGQLRAVHDVHRRRPGHRHDRGAGPWSSDDGKPDGLEPIETASRDELRALQLERLQWSCQHAYDNVAHYREKCQAQGVHPGRPADARGPGAVPVHQRSRTCATTIRSACSRCRCEQGGAHSRLQRHDRQADRGRLHAARHRQLGRPRGALDPRRRRPARRHGATSPTATACSPAASARTTAPSALGCTVIPMSRRADREAGAADPRLQAATSSWSRRPTCW